MPLILSALTLTLIYLAVGVIERTKRFRFRPLTSPRPYVATDIGWFAVTLAQSGIALYVLSPILARLTIGPVADRVDQLPLGLRFLIGLLIFDLVSFSIHCCLHRSDTLWSFHKVHHSTLELDGFATTRAHMFENLVRFVPSQLAMYLIGLPASLVAPTIAIVAIYAVSNHSNLKVRADWIEVAFVTPRLHRRHHVPVTTQNNFGTIFTFWDRMLGSLVRLDTLDDEVYGVPGEVAIYPQTFAEAARRPFADVREQRRPTVAEASTRQ